MKVLGIDPGYGRTGVAMVEGAPGRLRLIFADCISTPTTADISSRFLELFENLSSICAQYQPDTAAVEQLFLVHNQRTAMRVAEARGVILTVLAKNRIPAIEYTPTEVKSAVAAFGSASKPQVARMVCQLLGVTNLAGPDDAADACAVAICHHHRAALRTAVSRVGIR